MTTTKKKLKKRTVHLPVVHEDPDAWSPLSESQILARVQLPTDYLRPHQVDAINDCMAEFTAGKRIVFLDAPVGSGKTYISEAVRQLLDVRGLYICSTKSLQDQAHRDFEWSAVLKGRGNYDVQREDPQGGLWSNDFERATAADCTRGSGETCRWCDPVASCPYTRAKKQALAADLTILNTSYFLTESNRGPGSFTKRGLVVCDEGDLLESELMSMLTITVSKQRRKRYSLPFPERKTLPRDQFVQPAWGDWARETLRIVTAALDKLPQIEDPRASTNQIRERKSLGSLVDDLSQLCRELPQGGWILTDYEDESVTFKPVRVDRWGQKNLWRHGERFLVMSGTILSPTEMADSLGIQEDYGYVGVPMTYPVENRVIHYTPTATPNTAKNADAAVPEICRAVEAIARLHPGERILVHTVSYRLAGDVVQHLTQNLTGVNSRHIVTYTSARDRDAALESYLALEGSILIASSMDRGIDLPDDACRVQVVAKIPFPYLGDKQVNARLYSAGGQTWYRVNTLRSLLQSTGRGVRHPDDWAITYILDQSFGKLWQQSRRIIPQWWSEGLRWRVKAVDLERQAGL